MTRLAAPLQLHRSQLILMLHHMECENQPTIMIQPDPDGQRMDFLLARAGHNPSIRLAADGTMTPYFGRLAKCPAETHNPHGVAWVDMSVRELREARSWCMSPAHHNALAMHLADREVTV